MELGHKSVQSESGSTIPDDIRKTRCDTGNSPVVIRSKSIQWLGLSIASKVRRLGCHYKGFRGTVCWVGMALCLPVIKTAVYPLPG
jgi:hypothetical protein